MADVPNGCEDLEYFVQQNRIHRLRGPVNPLPDIVRIRTARDRCRDFGMSQRELQCELSNVDTTCRAMSSGVTCRIDCRICAY